MRNFTVASQFLLLLVCSCLLPSLIAAPANDHFSPLGFFRKDLRALNPTYVGGAVYVFNDPFALSAVASPPKVAVIGVTRTGEPDGFSFVAGEMLVAGTNVYFTDEEYRTSCSEIAFDNSCTGQGEPYLTYTVPAGGLPAGSVVSIVESVVTPNTFTVTGGGTVAFAGSGGFSLASSDGIIAFESNNASDPVNNITCIYSVLKIGGPYTGATTDGDNPVADYPDAVITILPAGADDAEFMPSLRSGMVTNDDIEDVSNWNIEDPAANLALSTTNFTGGIDLNFSAAACANPLPTATAFAIQPSCTGGVVDANTGYLQFSAVTDGTAYHWSEGSTFDDNGGANTFANATDLTGATFPLQFANGQSNPTGTQDYTIRVYNGEASCFTDVTVTMQEQDCTVGCDCDEYIYLNEVNGVEGVIHKFRVNPNGTLEEIFTEGAPWFSGPELPSPHGLGTDLNGYIYIGEAPFEGDIRRLTCDGEIFPEGSGPGEFSYPSGGQFNIGSIGNTVYYNPAANNDGIVGFDVCSGMITGTAEFCENFDSQDWGFYIDPRTNLMYATSTFEEDNNDNYLWIFSEDDFDNDPTTCVSAVTLSVPLPNGDIRGVVTDELGNIYVAVQNNTDLPGNPSMLLKYGPGPVYPLLAQSATDGADDGTGFNQIIGLVYSEIAQLIYASTEAISDDCVSIFSTSLQYLNTAVPAPGNGANGKGIAIATECCPTSSNQVVEIAQCNEPISEPIFLNEIYPCEGGIICEAQWTPFDAAAEAIFNSCNQSIMAGAPSGCYTFVRSSDGMGTAKQCGAFSITLNICISAPAATLTPTAATCTGSTANNNGTITLTAATNATHYGVSLGATYTGPTTIAGATAIPGTLPAAILTNAPNAGATYVVRLFNGADDCFVDETVVVAANSCAPASTCNCTDYLYINEVTNGGRIHKFSVDATDGNVTEILNGGNPWYPGAGTSQLPSPHGLGVDLNGYLYIGENFSGTNNIRRLTCDGGIFPETGPTGFVTPVLGFGLFNISSYEGFLYSNGANKVISKFDPCTGNLVGTITLDFPGSDADWGFYIDENGRFYHTTPSGQIIAHTPTEADFAMGATISATIVDLATDPTQGMQLSPPYSGAGLQGVTTDSDGNIYVVEGNRDAAGTQSRLLKFDASGNFIAAGQIDNVDDGMGWNRMVGIAYSPMSNRIYTSSLSPTEDCVYRWTTDLASDGTAVGPVPSSDRAKAIAIITECCPTTPPQPLSETVCYSGTAVNYFLNELYSCGDGVICEGQWSELSDPNNVFLFNDCDLSVTVSGEGCATYVLEKTTPATGNQQCGAFRIEVEICAGAPAATLTPTAATCTGSTDQNNGTITLAAATNATHYGVSLGATYTGPTTIAGATAIPGTLPAAILTNAPNAGATYVVRLFNGADDCFVDEVVMVAANICVVPCIDPTATLTTTPPTCTSSTEENNGTISLDVASNATHYGISSAGAATYDGPMTIAAATAVPGTLPAVILSNAPNAGATYIVRIFNGADDCFVDETVVVEETIVPTVEAGMPRTLCSTAQLSFVTLGASITPAPLGGMWTTSGDGQFLDFLGNPLSGDPSYLFGEVASYVPGPTDIMRGEVTLILTTFNPDGPCDAVSDAVLITILKVDCGSFPWGEN